MINIVSNAACKYLHLHVGQMCTDSELLAWLSSFFPWIYHPSRSHSTVVTKTKKLSEYFFCLSSHPPTPRSLFQVDSMRFHDVISLQHRIHQYTSFQMPVLKYQIWISQSIFVQIQWNLPTPHVEQTHTHISIASIIQKGWVQSMQV